MHEEYLNHSTVLPAAALYDFRYLVDCGAIKPLCDLLSTPDVRIVTVALEGLENILKVGQSSSSAAVW